MLLKKLKHGFYRLLCFVFNIHYWEYEKTAWRTYRTCKICGEKHENVRIVSQIYGSEHWYKVEPNEA